ncbi:MAG: hypothetical protein GY909_02665 [Oligoflexia bacterium]|nr:hypothetical protein [Oligoflexia bacterium]
MPKLLIILAFLLLVINTHAKGKKNVIVKYKQYEKFDLGNLEIKGKVIAPGDLSVLERKRKVFSRDLFERMNFDDKIKNDIKNLR